jgi:hypothetical protein
MRESGGREIGVLIQDADLERRDGCITNHTAGVTGLSV